MSFQLMLTNYNNNAINNVFYFYEYDSIENYCYTHILKMKHDEEHFNCGMWCKQNNV